jgi:hypothetical protein
VRDLHRHIFRLLIHVLPSPVNEDSMRALGSDVAFQAFIMMFMAALRAGVLNVEHIGTFLAHFGYLGPAYDSCLRDLPWVLQDAGIYSGEADEVQEVVGQALRDVSLSHEKFRESTVPELIFMQMPCSHSRCISNPLHPQRNLHRPCF